MRERLEQDAIISEERKNECLVDVDRMIDLLLQPDKSMSSAAN